MPIISRFRPWVLWIVAIVAVSALAFGAGTAVGEDPDPPPVVDLALLERHGLYLAELVTPPPPASTITLLTAVAESLIERAWYEALAEQHEAEHAAERSRSGSEGARTQEPGRTSPSGPESGSTGCAIPEYICECESGGSPTVVSSNGLWHGKYQFVPSTFNGALSRAADNEPDPELAAEMRSWVGTLPSRAPEWIQDRAAAQLYSERGGQPWGCA